MKVAIFGEFSGSSRRAFRKRGHDAYSFDFREAEDGDTRYHIRGDFTPHIDDTSFDLAIFHPTCRYTTNAGAKHLYIGGKFENGPDENRWDLMRSGAEFVRRCCESKIARKAIEQPIVHKHAALIIGRKATQIIQPWMFGHKEMKATCLYLFSLPELIPTNIVGPPPDDPEERKLWAKVHREPPGPDREKNRSRTLEGYAEAYAEQWGKQ